MTTVVILLMGFGAILIISAIETDPATGASVSVLQTFSDVWNNKVNFAQPAASGAGASTSTPSQPTGPGRATNPGASGTAHNDALRMHAANYWIHYR